MTNKQIETLKNSAVVFQKLLRSEDNSLGKMRISGNDLANCDNLERKLKSMKETLKDGCNQLLREFDEKLKEISEEISQTDLLIETAVKEVNKAFAEEKSLYKEVEKAMDDCVNANFNHNAKLQEFMMTKKTNKRKLSQLIETLDVKKEEPPACKVRKL